MSAPSLIAKQLRTAGRFLIGWQRSHKANIRFPKRKRLNKKAVLALSCAASILASAFFLAFSPNLPKVDRSAGETTERMPLPNIKALLATVLTEDTITPSNIFIRNGETLSSLFVRLGINDPQAFDFIRSSDMLRPFVLPQPGQYVSAKILPDGRLSRLRIYLEGPHERDSRTIDVTRHGELFVPETFGFSFDTVEKGISGTAASSFSRTVSSIGIPDNVADQLREVWEGPVNPVKRLKKGDTVRLIYEQKFAEGNFIRDGQLLAAQIVSNGKTYEAYWFGDDIKAGSFYTLEGKSSKQTFLRVPLEIQDVSSEFAALRRHPVTGVLRPHNGTDFRAPAGSRIFAAADGVVTFVGYERKGYGRYLKIDHGLGRTTVYAHMSRVAPLKKGMRVHKGEIIGYVGQTGLATGPHLHYELMIDGVQINPRTADLPDTENLSAFQLAQLLTFAEPLQAQFRKMAENEIGEETKP